MHFLICGESTSVESAVRAFEHGATGYVLKSSSIEELERAIEAVSTGETFISPSFATKVIASLRQATIRARAQHKLKLSVREDQIIEQLQQGFTNKQIAERLQVSEKTVKYYMTVLMQKLRVRNRVEVIMAAQKLAGNGSGKSGAANLH